MQGAGDVVRRTRADYVPPSERPEYMGPCHSKRRLGEAARVEDRAPFLRKNGYTEQQIEQLAHELQYDGSKLGETYHPVASVNIDRALDVMIQNRRRMSAW